MFKEYFAASFMEDEDPLSLVHNMLHWSRSCTGVLTGTLYLYWYMVHNMLHIGPAVV